MHIVHKYADTEMELGGVIGIFFDTSAGNYDNDFLEALWGDGDDVDINLQSFLSNIDFSEYWNYPGSLTTPPCTEGIKWTVIKDVQPISDAQLERFTALWADLPEWAAGMGNNRMVQDLGDRVLYFEGDLQALEEEAMSSSGAYSLSVATATLTAALTYLAF